ncbi:MAG: HEPN domain-containing protein [Sedimentisphaerales bacterium]|nr:HEPN domain-containing protein [Sedimentisphaerales bacterium]
MWAPVGGNLPTNTQCTLCDGASGFSVARIRFGRYHSDMGFLRELSAFYIPTRYPGEVADIALGAKEGKARQVLNQSEEFVEWLNSTPL